jgi:SAM-dependent methyltransferase
VIDALANSRRLWDRHARRDPLWAILSEPAKKGRWNLERFFQTGVGEIVLVLYQLRSRGITVARRMALDFGCGVGRLAQALAQHFAHVDGVDVSPAMIDLARSLNRYGERVAYHANDRPDLALFADGTFDFIVTSIVLQHIEPPIASRYLTELCRVLAHGGTLVFQVPARKRNADDPPAAAPVERISNVPDEAYRAWLSVAGAPAAAVQPCSKLELQVDVVNASAFEWSLRAFGVIRVGNRWFDASGYAMLVADDGRASLQEPLSPGDQCSTRLIITTPLECGDYWCEIDLAHEGVVWFRERGSTAVRFPVRVRSEPDLRRDYPALAGDEPPAPVRDPIAQVPEVRVQLPSFESSAVPQGDLQEFPMFGIPQDEVLELLSACSMEVIAVDDDRSCGDDWISYRYFTRKRV